MRRRWRPSRLVAQVGQISPSEFDPSRLLVRSEGARGRLPLALSLRSDARWQACCHWQLQWSGPRTCRRAELHAGSPQRAPC